MGGTKKLKNFNKKQKIKYEEKGITLIALVITIIVLLILAGVSIATLTGENGILTKANDAKDKTQIADVKEQVQMDILAEQMENTRGNLLDTKLKEILDKYFENVPEADKLEGELKKDGGLKLKSKAKYGGQQVDIGEIYDGNLAKEPKPVTVEELEESLVDSTKVQYVTNYGIDIDKDGKSEDDWEIFYVEDYNGENNLKDENQSATEKRVFLIASDYVHADTQALKDAVVKEKASMTSGTGKSADYVKYWNTSDVTDMPTYSCTFAKLFEFSQYDINKYQKVNNLKCVRSLLYTENWSSFVNDGFAECATGGPSVEMWINSWNKRHKEKPLYYKGQGYGIENGYKVDTNQTSINSYSVSVGNNSDKLYFPHDAENGDFDKDGNEEACYGYWLASPSDYDRNYVMKIDCEGLVNNIYYYYKAYGVRPIVCLKSDVKFLKSSEDIGISNAECFELVN